MNRWKILEVPMEVLNSSMASHWSLADAKQQLDLEKRRLYHFSKVASSNPDSDSSESLEVFGIVANGVIWIRPDLVESATSHNAQISPKGTTVPPSCYLFIR